MKPNLLFRIDEIILLFNGVMAAFLTEIFFRRSRDES